MKKTIKSLALLGLLITSVTFYSCEEKTGLEIKFNQDNEAIMVLLPTSQLRIDTVNIITSQLDSMLAANNATREDISKITLATIDVGLCDSLGNDDYTQNFNEFDSVGVRVFVPNDNTVPDVLVANAKVPRGLWGFGLALTQEEFDFLPYAEKNTFAVGLKAKLISPVTVKKYVKIKIRVDIVALI